MQSQLSIVQMTAGTKEDSRRLRTRIRSQQLRLVPQFDCAGSYPQSLQSWLVESSVESTLHCTNILNVLQDLHNNSLSSLFKHMCLKGARIGLTFFIHR